MTTLCQDGYDEGAFPFPDAVAEEDEPANDPGRSSQERASLRTYVQACAYVCMLRTYALCWSVRVSAPACLQDAEASHWASLKQELEQELYEEDQAALDEVAAGVAAFEPGRPDDDLEDDPEDDPDASDPGFVARLYRTYVTYAPRCARVCAHTRC